MHDVNNNRRKIFCVKSQHFNSMDDVNVNVFIIYLEGMVLLYYVYIKIIHLEYKFTTSQISCFPSQRANAEFTV